MKLSILIPVYNERQWIETVVGRALAQPVEGIDECEVVIVDDCSCDGTREIIEELARKDPARIAAFFHQKNMGKGAALQTAIEHMAGDICIVQDADLEYDPADYPLVLRPIIDGRADCVYGSRFTSTQEKRVLFFWHSVGNKMVTLLSNICTNLTLTDMEVGYKAFRAEVLKSIPIRSRDFGFEPEVTAKIARKRCRIYEVGIRYSGRTYQEGKKITWIDGVRAVGVILKYWIIDDTRKK